MLELAGQDADDMFEATGHSNEARDIMKKYLIGNLKVYASYAAGHCFNLCTQNLSSCPVTLLGGSCCSCGSCGKVKSCFVTRINKRRVKPYCSALSAFSHCSGYLSLTKKVIGFSPYPIDSINVYVWRSWIAKKRPFQL
jgi:hypothetical protein